MLPAAAVMLSVGVVSLVRPPIPTLPVPGARSSLILVIDGADGAVVLGGAAVWAAVLTVRLTLLLASAPSALRLPAASLNLLLATLIEPAVVLFAAGVKVAV